MSVAVLPNGTIEHNDPIFLYTKKWDLTSHKATDVKVTDDSEDLVNLKTALYNEQYNHRKTNDSLLTLSLQYAAQSADLEDKIKEYNALQAKLDEAEQDLRDAQQARNKWEKKARTAETDLQERNAKMEGLRRSKEAEIRELEGKVARAEKEHGVHHWGMVGWLLWSIRTMWW